MVLVQRLHNLAFPALSWEAASHPRHDRPYSLLSPPTGAPVGSRFPWALLIISWADCYPDT